MGRRTLLLIISILLAAGGTALVALYVRTADTRAQDQEQRVSVLVAARDLDTGKPVGEVISTAFEDKSYPKGLAPANAYPGGDAGLARLNKEQGGDTPLSRIFKGQVIVPSMFGEKADTSSRGIDKENVAITLNLADPNRVAGLVGPGSEVAIYGVFTKGREEPTVKVLIPRVQVIKVGALGVSPPADGTAPEAVPNALVSLNVSPDEALKLALARSTAELSLALLGEDASVAEGSMLGLKGLLG
jgi:pilus assembly protein CpaB